MKDTIKLITILVGLPAYTIALLYYFYLVMVLLFFGHLWLLLGATVVIVLLTVGFYRVMEWAVEA